MRQRLSAPLNWIQWLTLGLAVSTALAFMIVFTKLDNESAHRNDALRNVICAVNYSEQHNPKLSATQKLQAAHFWNRLLKTIKESPCSFPTRS